MRQVHTLDSGKVLIISAFIPALITFLVYLPALQGGFVNWDDWDYVLDNPNIRSIDLSFLRWVVSAVVLSNWHPLTVFSLALDYSVWGSNPLGFHLTNNIFHAVDTFLVGILTVKLSLLAGKDSGYTAAVIGSVAALLFGLHPVHVESVSWVSERKDVLSVFFFLLSIIWYLKYAASRKKTNYIAALLFFLLSLSSKPMAISLPVVLLLLDFYPLERFRLKAGLKGITGVVIEKLPFFALSVMSAALTLWAQQKAIKPLVSYSMIERISVAVRQYGFYIHKMVLPSDLAPFYPLPSKSEFLDYKFFLSLVLLLSVTAFSLALVRRKKIFLAAWLYYLITLVPVIGIVQVGEQAGADRYTYLPSLSIIMLAGAGVGRLWETGRGSALRIAVASVSAIVIIALSALTVRQIAFWKDSITLWSHEIAVYPDEISPAYYNRGLAYDREGRYDEALKNYTSSIELDPSDTRSYLNRGIIHSKRNRYDLALADFNMALMTDSSGASATKIYMNRGVAFLSMGQPVKAIENYNLAIELDPENEAYYVNRGIAYGNIGEYERAVNDFSTAISLAPSDADAYQNRAIAYLSLGDSKKAASDFSATLKLNPRNPVALYNMGLISLKSGEREKAAAYLKDAYSLGVKEAKGYLTKEDLE